MKQREYLDLELNESACEFDTADKLRRLNGVLSVNVVAHRELIVKYNPRKIAPEAIRSAAENGRKRVVNRKAA